MSLHPVAAAAYTVFLVKEVFAGAARVVRIAASRAGYPPPSIVEFPLRCRSDLEISLMASSITITPGTLVVGTASARHGSPPTLYVHSVFGGSRQGTLDGLHDMEGRLLRATRGSHGDIRPAQESAS